MALTRPLLHDFAQRLYQLLAPLLALTAIQKYCLINSRFIAIP
jgi:hypothetical protein